MSKRNETIIEKEDKEIFYILFNRPEKRNALREPMRENFAKAIEKVKKSEKTKICVITGTGNSFCAGGDLKIMRQLVLSGNVEEIGHYMKWMVKAVIGIKSLTIPVIAAINGPAMGAGMNIALACDIRIASDRSSFGQPYTNLGLYPDWGGTYFLPRVVGLSKTLELFWTGKQIDTEEAEKLGLVDIVYSDKDYQNKLDEFLLNLARRPKNLITRIKKNILASSKDNLLSILEEERKTFLEYVNSDYFKKLIKDFGKKS